MPKFRKKPVVIEAIQWVGTNIGEIKEFVGIRNNGESRFLLPRQATAVWDFGMKSAGLPHVYDELHDTWVGVNPNDWIIRGIQGEFYPCKADVFKETYEAV